MRKHRVAALGACTAVLVTLQACSTLPTSGPTGHEIVKNVNRNPTSLALKVVDVTPFNYQAIAASSREERSDSTLATLASAAPTTLIEPGDKLAITIYEVGFTLFGSSSSIGNASAGTSPTQDLRSNSQKLAEILVDADGAIKVPYAGYIHAAGLTPNAVGSKIEHALEGKSQKPQVLVSIDSSVSSAAYVAGDVKTSVRIPLGVAPVRLTQALVLAGGTLAQSADSIVRVHRASQQLDQRLNAIAPGSPDDLTLSPGDEIEVISV